MIKFSLRAIAYIAALGLLFISCNSEDDNGGGAAPGTFQVDFDGQTYVADEVGAQIFNDIINIVAVRGTEQELFSITLRTSTTGTFQLDGTDNDYGAVYAPSNGANGYVSLNPEDFSEVTGEVQITEIDETNHLISGNFHFKGYKYAGVYLVSRQFSDGSFTDIPYTTDAVVANGNTFSALVDGQPLNPTSVIGLKTNFAGNTLLSIKAQNGSKLITLGLMDLSVGQHSIGATNIAVYANSTSDDNMGAGTVNITTHDATAKHIVGMFSFNTTQLGGGSATHSITQGSFDVYYQD